VSENIAACSCCPFSVEHRSGGQGACYFLETHRVPVLSATRCGRGGGGSAPGDRRGSPGRWHTGDLEVARADLLVSILAAWTKSMNRTAQLACLEQSDGGGQEWGFEQVGDDERVSGVVLGWPVCGSAILHLAKPSR
jgi:hypothetical protein